jgi:prepilin-type N-terminal cleavage/methylation domain-containing protein
MRHAGRNLSHAGISAAAFTLIELLVVVAILALLMSILLPSLANARDRARTSVCLTNLRGLGYAVHSYCGDNKGTILPARYRVPSSEGTARSDSPDMWGTILVNLKYISAPTHTNRPDITRADSPLRCPSGTNRLGIDPANYLGDGLTGVPPEAIQKDPSGAGCYPQQSTSTGKTFYVDCWYGINAETWKTELTPFVNYPNDGGGKILYSLDRLKRAGDLVGIIDGWWLVDVWWERINARHDRVSRTNILLMDGHAKTFDTATLPFGYHLRVPYNQEPFLSSPYPFWHLDQITYFKWQ